MIFFIHRVTGSESRIPIRLFLSNKNGYHLDMSMYKEVREERTGHVMFQAYGSKQGPLHNLLLNTPYITKDHLQLKRFKAQSNGTTYVYDFPEMFRQSLQKVWKDYRNAGGSIEEPETLMSCVELVLDDRDQLCEMNRLHGENDVRYHISYDNTLRPLQNDQIFSTVFL